jgi:hypothetical protein
VLHPDGSEEDLTEEEGEDEWNLFGKTAEDEEESAQDGDDDKNLQDEPHVAQFTDAIAMGDAA